ncbi:MULTISPECIES: 5-methylcytosine-specific restriction endonuclease system specificity protein McrC [Clostridia]|uniref:5-methylcytosine-specific restriction enzyme subunit McrC n=1 Tax=Aminicella lysinilytica TaxID=433323 RepID=A0A4R6Q3K0_9FIRM|nr:MULTISPECIES: 5-methylcytosine-specific restriction endonuclease system specificity protein McrC [Clostridia]MDT4376946.1 5-methylcytosine-specific restriction endonuclease system specificity protein McrC [Blautia coccoides]TDP56420.1 5-methylcytosine-specific restriction enzyme subunit McrC [Aminicella lysinilytica]
MIRIHNIYYMLSYAFQVLNENGYKKVLTEEFDKAGELCAEILIKGVSSQLKRGLNREYLTYTESMSAIKGKIDISSSIKQQTTIQRKLICSYDDFSVNSYPNRIIKTTMYLLVRSSLSKKKKQALKKLLIYFGEVDILDVHNINWKLQYNKNNQTYQMLISICYLIIKGLLQTTTSGNVKLMDFLDEQRMSRLYEKFILEYYKKEHPELRVSAMQIQWNLDDESDEFLPIMQSDTMLSNGIKTLIIDAKYYSRSMQTYYDKHTLHSANLYQIYTYVKNYDVDNTGDVSGLLVYAKTDGRVYPDSSYTMARNKIGATTLDLDKDFKDIKIQLDEIVNKYFPAE